MKHFSQSVIKLLMLFVGLFALAPLANAHNFTAGSTLYVEFTDGQWPQSNAVLYAQFFTPDSSQSGWLPLNKVEGDTYSVVVPSGNYSKMNLVRVNPNNNDPENNDNRWDYKYNIDAPDPSNNNNLLKYSGWKDGTVTWGTYSATTTSYNYWFHGWKTNSSDLNKQFVNGSFTMKGSDFKGYTFGIQAQDASTTSYGDDAQKAWYKTTSAQKYVNTYGNTEFTLAVNGTTGADNFSPTNALEDNKEYTFTLTFDSNNVPVKLTVTGPEQGGGGGGTITYPTQGTYMYASWLGQPYGKVGTFSTEANAGSGSFTLPAATYDRKIYYVVYRDGGRYGHKGSNKEQKITDISYKNAVMLESVQSTDNDCFYFYVTIPANREVTFNFSSSFDCNDNINGYNQKGVPAVWLTDMKAVTVDASRAGKVYLINKLLNDNHESPAWEMVKQLDGTYYLAPFAMRELEKGEFTSGSDADFTKLKIAVYDANGYRSEKEVSYSGFDKTYENILQPGWRYSAKLDAAQANVTFTEEKVDGRSVLPYIGVLGQNFRQAKEYTTRHNYGSLMGKTSYGWQEAYIEYDSEGQPILESDGKAIYNTVWPPRNDILMTSHISDDIDDLNVSTNELTLKRDSRGVKKGSEWTAALQTENADEYKENYGDGKGFKLDANTKYARYYVENVWMLGSYKIWTGWGGQQATWGAYWNSHTYVGSAVDDKNDQDKVINIHDAFGIKGRGSNFMTGNDGKNREYYRTMELFLPVADDDETDYIYAGENSPRLYLTEADGGAVIDAVARQNKYVGYVPTLANMPNGYRLKDYKITRYRYVANDDKNDYKPVDRQNHEVVNESDAIVKSQSWDDNTIDTNEKFNALFTKDSEIFSSKYVNDGEYKAGRYIFKLNVTFVDSQADDKTRTAEVWSPYVEIFDVEGNINISADQLIELPSDFEGEYTHVTYDPAYTGAKLVKVEGDKVTAIANADNTDNKIQKVYEQTGAWTNTALITVSDPAGFAGTTNSFTVSKGSGETYVSYDLLNKAYKIDGTGSNYVVDNNALNLLKTRYEAAFDGTLSSEGGSASADYNANVTYSPTFMLPALKKAELTSGDDVNAADMTATHEHVWYMAEVEDSNVWTHQQTVNAHHNNFGVRVPVQMPNISAATAGLKEAVYAALSVKLSLDSEADIEMTPNSDAADYALNYTYQSPYDWMEHDGETWKATGHSWNLGNSSYNNATTAIAGVFPTLDASYETSATLAPAFKAPEFDYIPGSENKIWFGSKVDGDEDGNGFDIEIFIKQINAKTQEGNKLADGVNLNAGNHDALVLLISTSVAEKADRIVSKVVKVSDLENSANTHTIVKYHSAAKNYGELYWDLQDWFNNKVQIEAAYAYYFDSEGADGTSEFSGFTGTFPGIRYDKKPANGSSKAAPSQSDSSATLAAGDNSFLLAPAYTVLMAEGDGIMTGVDDIIDAAGNVTVGEGFIDLNGNNGMVFSADGCMVYSGAARCEVEKGVYVVTVNGKSTKVIVK